MVPPQLPGARCHRTAMNARLREIRERQMGEAPRPGEVKVTGVEATILGEE